jgi:hypothetical protein
LKLAYWIRWKGDDDKYRAEIRKWEDECARVKGEEKEVRVEVPVSYDLNNCSYLQLFERVKRVGEFMGVMEEL